MSEHHHHRPHEGHSTGGSPARHTKRRGWFFWLSGIILFFALLGFILEGAFWRFAPVEPVPASQTTPAASTDSKR
jgi:hypothetical protein